MSDRSSVIQDDILAYLELHERKQLLRFLTCGSVDDGKSTLIGRLLYDSKQIYDDQLAALRRDSATHGSVDGDFDPALLTDGLKAEREQGITIDVAYRYFSTDKRKFIIADTPGHEQYTRNMVTGASNCDLAIILVDARHGILAQTKRHSYIASLLGIDRVIVAINKMDLVDFSEARYRELVADYQGFAAQLDVGDTRFIPMSALRGDNVVNRSTATPWYTQAPLLELLETIPVAGEGADVGLRFPVQYVIRPNLDFRGFAGTIAAGAVQPGDELLALPSKRRSRVKSIVTYGGELERAGASQAVTITLEDEIDLSRGDMLVDPDRPPQLSARFDADVVWMADDPLAPGREYLVKVGPQTVPGQISGVRYRVDVNTLGRRGAATLRLNEIGRCELELSAPVVFDAYARNRGTGAFIVIDRISNSTVGAGMIVADRWDGATDADGEQRDRWEAGPRFELTSTRSLVSLEERADRFGHSPVTILLTGLSGAGKTTIAYGLEKELFRAGRNALVFDGANMRRGISKDLGFSAAERSENLRRSAELARMLNDSGLICICAFVAPEDRIRRRAAALVGEQRFLVVHVDAPLEVCREREPLYRGLKEGVELAGVSFPYEPPPSPDLVLDTVELRPEQAIAALLELLERRGFIRAATSTKDAPS